MLKEICGQAGIQGKTNHSLRASEMFKAGVPEKIIQECTGHRSVKALRMYERTTSSQHIAVSRILSAPTEKRFDDSTTGVPARVFAFVVHVSPSSAIVSVSCAKNT